jgi:hypothetical protein
MSQNSKTYKHKQPICKLELLMGIYIHMYIYIPISLIHCPPNSGQNKKKLFKISYLDANVASSV